VSPGGNRYELSNTCIESADVLDFSPALASETVEGARYDEGPAPPYIASVLKPHTSAHPWIALTNGWNLESQVAPGSDTDVGRINFYYDVFKNVFAVICPQIATTLAVPDAALQEFLRIDGNPARHGETRVHFAIARAAHAEVRLYDVAGRAVRTLADRAFPAGEHVLRWDGTNDEGRALASGVYFARMHVEGRAADSRKVVLLGR